MATIRQLVSQATDLCAVQALGSTISFSKPTDAERHSLSGTVLSDAGRSATNGQHCYVASLFLGELFLNPIFHVLSRSSHKSKRPVRSIGAAEILPAGKEIDEKKILSLTMSIVLATAIPLHVILDSEELYNSLSTTRNFVDKSIGSDVYCIRFDFER